MGITVRASVFAFLMVAMINVSSAVEPIASAYPSFSQNLVGCRSLGCTTDGCATEGCDVECAAENGCGIRLDREASSIFGDDNFIDSTFNAIFGCKNGWDIPVNVGGWHWWHIDTGGVGNGGYGAKGFDGTYAYYTTANPSLQLENGRTLGGFVFFAGRDGDEYRRYYNRRFWFLEGYVSLVDPQLGTFKAGLINTNFGLDYYLGFIGNAPYFDGFIQDPDYGFSWEKTTQPNSSLTIDSSLQFFIRDGEWNGGLTNHDQETVPGINERNTFVARVTPTLQLDEDTTLAWGLSGLVGEIDSRVPGFPGGTRAVWGTHADFVRGPLNLRGEVLQIFGPTVPTRFSSGGPSNRITSYSTEAAYTVGPVKYRTMWTQSHEDNPNGRQSIWGAGVVLQVTPHIRTFVEYADWTVDGHAAVGDVPILQGVSITVHWQY